MLSAVNYTIIANAHATFGDPACTFDVFNRMREQNIAPTDVTLRTAIKACERWTVTRRSVEAMMTMLNWASSMSLGYDSRTWNLALRTLVRKGAFTQALDVLEWMRNGNTRRPLVPAANNCSFNIGLLALGKQGRFQEAVYLFGELLASNKMPDVITYNTLLELAISAKRMPLPWGCETMQNGKPYCDPTPFVQAVLQSMARQRVQPNVTTETLILRLLTRNSARTPDKEFIWSRMRQVCHPGRQKDLRVDKKVSFTERLDAKNATLDITSSTGQTRF